MIKKCELDFYATEDLCSKLKLDRALLRENSFLMFSAANTIQRSRSEGLTDKDLASIHACVIIRAILCEQAVKNCVRTSCRVVPPETVKKCRETLELCDPNEVPGSLEYMQAQLANEILKKLEKDEEAL